MTLNTTHLSAQETAALASELTDAMADGRNCYASSYHLYRRLLGFYGITEAAQATAADILSTARAIMATLNIKSEPVNTLALEFEAARKASARAKKSNKPRIGDRISWQNIHGETFYGVIEKVSTSGKSIDVRRDDGILTSPQRNMQIIG